MAKLPVLRIPRKNARDTNEVNEVVITRNDVKFIFVLTFVYVPYSLFMAYDGLDPVLVAVAVGSIICLLFIISLLLFDEAADERIASSSGKENI
ncbi:hypothetical protein [Haloarchaeobius sp. TZWSO28]|uniref:hypothetical protein n=1 Tax=Haloarchaeobius sp. TZWSO28 TaxID=3446119 RepID=UPI003EB7840A